MLRIGPCLLYNSRMRTKMRMRLMAARGGHAMEDIMAWTTPVLVEICIGLEINGYLPAEF
jgi:coenzyme PQQ precursor peptide PqqA